VSSLVTTLLLFTSAGDTKEEGGHHNLLNINNSYTLLAQFLRPTQTLGTDSSLLRGIRSGDIDWPSLLHQANHQVVTPLWYLNLCRDGLIDTLPKDLAVYLGELYAANLDRNRLFSDALAEALDICQREGLSPLLLKGSAAFADDLFGDVGARIQSDLDLLLQPDQACVLSDQLLQLGYRVLESEDDLTDNALPTAHHHHLKALYKPGTPVVIEIHYRAARGKAGEALKDAQTVPVTVAGIECHMLGPEWRDLHNIIHAMVADRGTLHSLVSLKAAAESAWLIHRYPEADFQKMAGVAEACGYGYDYHLYRTVSKRLGLWHEDHYIPGDVTDFRIDRCLEHGSYLTQEHTPRQLSLYLALYRKLNFPRWAWNYICYLDSSSSFWERLKKMGRYLFRPTSWKKI
jgi:hypothetical protein